MRTVEVLFGTLSLTLLLSLSAKSQRPKSTVLPSSETKKVTNQCSRPSPEKYSDTWQPSASVIKEMESLFDQIKKLKVEECCLRGAQIEDPESFYMQYVGIVVNNKRLIYINALPALTPDEGWKENAVIICDGGTAWGVVYDPESKKFFDLAINGIG